MYESQSDRAEFPSRELLNLTVMEGGSIVVGRATILTTRLLEKTNG